MTTEVKNAAKEVRYPKEVYSALTTDKVLSVTAHLLPVEVDGGNSPYKIYQPGKSRFVFSIINTKEKTFPTGNIRIDEIAGILANTKAAHQIDVFAKLPVLHQLFDGIKTVNKMVKGLQDAFKLLYRFVRTGQTSPVQETKKVEVNENSLAKTVMIGNGKMKGKTPFQVISESTEVQKAIFDLETQYKWLEKNLAQYPDNAVQMSAIKEALKLYQTGEIHPSDQSIGEKLNFGTIAIYEPTPRALIREKDEDGFCPVYEIAINWHVAERYPVEIRVKRYKAPVLRKETGAINPQRSEAIDVEENNFRLTASQWADCTHLMEANMNRFEFVMAARQFREAEEADAANRAAAKQK